MSHNPLAWGDIRAWMELTLNYLSAWEVSVIKAMDRDYLKTAAELSKVK